VTCFRPESNRELKDQEFVSKNSQKHHQKIVGLRPTPPYGAALLPPPTQVGAKCLAAVVLDNHNRAHSQKFRGNFPRIKSDPATGVSTEEVGLCLPVCLFDRRTATLLTHLKSWERIRVVSSNKVTVKFPLRWHSRNEFGVQAQDPNSLTLGVCFSQTCSSAGRMSPASRSRSYYFWRIISFPQQQIQSNTL